jgi:hypothetical protein
VVAEIVSQTGIKFSSVLPKLEIRRKPEGMTYREVLGHLAGCCGKNARFNRNGVLEFVWYTDSGVTIQRETQYMNGFTKLNPKPIKVDFSVTGKEETYNVTVVTDNGGHVVATPGRNALEGDIIMLSINSYYGYELAEISAVSDKGETITLSRTSDSGRAFVQPDSNVTVTASFKQTGSTECSVNVKSNGHGTIGSSKKTAKKGQTVTITVSPSAGYELDSFTVVPASVSLTAINATEYTFTMPDSDVTIGANFAEIQAEYNISYQIDKGYMTVSARTAKAGSIVTVTLMPQVGYELACFDSNVAFTQTDTNVYTFIMPAEDVYIIVRTKYIENNVQAVSTFALSRAASDAIIIDSPHLEVTTQGDQIIIRSNVINVTTSGDTLNITLDNIVSDNVTMEYTNPLIYEKMLPTIKSLVQGITYTPAKLKHRGNPALQAGDVIRVPDKDGLLHTIPIMQQTINLGGGMNSEISCPGKTEKTKSFSSCSPTQTQIKRAVEESNYEFERRMSFNNSMVYAALNKDISKNKAEIELVAQHQTTTTAAVASLEETVTANSASLKTLAEWQGGANESIASLEQRATNNESNISAVVENGKASARLILRAINNQDGEQSEALLQADKIIFEGYEYTIDADHIQFKGQKLDIKVDATNIEGELTADQINAEGLEVRKGIIGGWTLGKVNVPVNGSTNIEADALDSGELTTTKDGRTYTYRVYLTADGVYVAGRYDTSSESGVPYYGHKTWLDIVGG